MGLASVLAFAALVMVVTARGGLPFDDSIASVVKGIPIPVRFWEACTFAGGPLLIPVGILMGIIALITRRVRLAIVIAVTLIGAAVFTEVAKDLIARPRPPGEALAPWLGSSFPSGHTLNSTVTYGLIAVVTWRSRLPLAVRRGIVAACVLLPLLVGLSRVALGVHYPSDVLAGWLAGIAFVALGACLIRFTGAIEPDPPSGRVAP